jgi:hypothetical protein
MYFTPHISLLFLLVLSPLFIHCSSSQDQETPSSSNEEFIGLLVDVHLAEAALQRVRPAERDSMGEIYYQILADAHGMEVEEVLDVINRISEDPKKLEKLYELVLDSINRLEMKLIE